MNSSKSSYPEWLFDDSPIDDPFGYGERAVKFIRALRHPKSTLRGHAFQLDPWQERIVRAIYGPRHDDGRRIVREVIIMIPRGNRKTSLGAALALLHTIGPESMPGGESMCAASDRSQARIAYQEAYNIIGAMPLLDGKLRMVDSSNHIKNPRNGAFFAAMSADGKVAHGHTPVFALVDEIHAWPKRDLWEAINSGLAKVPNSLKIVISTAGRGGQTLAAEVFDRARKIARGEIIEPATLVVMFETPRDADWQDEDNWYRVNPGLPHGYPDIEGLRHLARTALQQPTERSAFQQLNLNMWLDHSSDPFVDMVLYDKGKGAVDLDELEAEQTPCWLAVDLSSNGDLTCVVACWKDGDDGFQVKPWYFCPEPNLRLRAQRDGVPYVEWADDELITPTPGEAVDLRVIEAHIREVCATFNVQEIAFDPHYGRIVMSNLLDDGLPVIEMRQGWVTMGPAVKELERVILRGAFRHGGHPVLRWNFDNIVVHVDSAGNMMFHKGKSRDRIDGAVATAMAVARAAAGESGVSSYETFSGNIEEWAFA